MVTVGLTDLNINDAAIAWDGSSAAPKAWQSGGEGQGSGNFGENHKHHALYLRVGHKKATKKQEACQEQHAPHELNLEISSSAALVVSLHRMRVPTRISECWSLKRGGGEREG